MTDKTSGTKPGSDRSRRLGSSDLWINPVGFGCWPIAGVSSLGVNDEDSLATIHAALDGGINLVDTAFSYGYEGEADKLLAQVLADRRSEVVLCSKVGQYFDSNQQRVVDGRPETILQQSELALQRLGVEYVDVMYLHVPDSKVAIQESAAAIAEVIHRGWAKYAGVSNVNLQQLTSFHAVCPIVVVQPPYNMLQQHGVSEIVDHCLRSDISIVCYWALMKGLLAGKLSRQHRFDPRDKRLTYAIYQGTAWERSQDLLDLLRGLASELGSTVAQLVVAWTISQPGITAALCGAKRPQQITETAGAVNIELTADDLAQIDSWIVAADLDDSVST